VQLLSTADRRTLWATSFDEHASSAFAIQDAIVTRLIGELAPRLSATVQSRLATSGTRNEAAYEAHLKGRALVVRATGPELKRAAASFRAALELDPAYVDAWAGLAAASVRQSIVGDVNPTETFPEARRAAIRAQELDPEHPEAMAVLGLVAFWHEWDYARAERLFRAALSRQPSYAYARVFLAHLLSNLGRHQESLDEMRLALELDPAWPVARSLEAQFLTMAGRADEALARMNALLDLEPRSIVGRYQRTVALLGLGRYDEAVAGTEAIVDLEADLPGAGGGPRRTWTLALRGFGEARAGRVRDAQTTLADIQQLAASQYVPPYHEALVLHALGRDGQALARLGAAVDARDVFVTFVGVDPKWNELRASPDFQAVASRVNLLDVSNRTLAARR
jgi:tetratricopeptide (TPR) repeat protein